MLSVTREMLIPHSEYYRKRSRATNSPNSFHIQVRREFTSLSCHVLYKFTSQYGYPVQILSFIGGSDQIEGDEFSQSREITCLGVPTHGRCFLLPRCTSRVHYGVTWKSPTLPSISEQDFSIARLKVEKYSQQLTSILLILSPWLDTWRIYKYPTDLFTPWWCQACGSEKRQPPSQENQTSYWQSQSIKRARGCLRRRKCPVLQMCPS